MFVEGRDWDWINSYPTTVSGYSQRLSPCRSYQEIRECLAMDQIPFFFSFFFFFFISETRVPPVNYDLSEIYKPNNQEHLSA